MNSSTIEALASRISGSNSWRDVLAKSIKQRIVRIRSKHRVRRDIDALMVLDDRMLADIGIRRGDLEFAVRHGRLPDRGHGNLG